MSQGKLSLGIDLGTTSVKVVVYSRNKGEIIAKQSKDTQANVPSDLGIDGNKQDVPKILSAVHSCVSRLPKDLLRQVTTIGVCGQMHGVTLWKCQPPPHGNEKTFKLEIDKGQVSHLYTWQDSRCDNDFLEGLPPSASHLPVHPGYGCATLFWFARNKPEKLTKYDRCGTVQDLMVNLLSGAEEVVMSHQNAASFGYFLTEEGKFEVEVMEKGNFPVNLLPRKILKAGETAGHLVQTWFGIPAGVPIGVALGDLQCSVLALLKGQDEAVMNISTSAQLTYVHPDFKGEVGDLGSIEYFPYFGGEYLAVAASLNGGNTLASFVKMVQQWTMDLGFSVPQSKVWEKLISLGQEDSAVSSMRIEPLLLGERHDPHKTASVSGISLDTLQLGTVFRSLCSGVIQNLHGMMSQEVLKKKGIKKIVGNGSGLVRNPVLQKEVQHWYKLPLELGHSGDAALGAAIAGVASE
ncbi:sedoheptulokinase-like [Diachasmimorpha longicaudata]|uniref:sedoheptulokinase-like n=1 Tax=Diachasmimorpha longicaudata TaxID=58733 RepID=UPI0030B8F98D